MSDFEGTDIIQLQPSDKDIDFLFELPKCTGVTANDGALPYGSTITDATVKAYDESGTEKTAELVVSTGIDGQYINVRLQYPTSGNGRYTLTFIITINTGGIFEFVFTRVYVTEIR